MRATLSVWLGRILGVGTSTPAKSQPGDFDLASFKLDGQDGSPDATQGLVTLLDEIERGALTIYAEHDLPGRRGHYGLPPGSTHWTFISENLSPEERWRLALDRPTWRFAKLEDLGDPKESIEVRKAGKILAACSAIRYTIRSNTRPGLAEQFEAAIMLGQGWREMREPKPLRSGKPLKFVSVTRTRGVKS